MCCSCVASESASSAGSLSAASSPVICVVLGTQQQPAAAEMSFQLLCLTVAALVSCHHQLVHTGCIVYGGLLICGKPQAAHRCLVAKSNARLRRCKSITVFCLGRLPLLISSSTRITVSNRHGMLLLQEQHTPQPGTHSSRTVLHWQSERDFTCGCCVLVV